MHSEKVRFCILGASFGNPNLGVAALAAGIVTSIAARYPEAQISILDYAYEPSIYHFRVGGRTVPIQTVNLRFSKKLYLPNNIVLLMLVTLMLRLVPSKALRRKWMARNATLRHIQEADAILSIAGGDSFSDIYGLGRLMYVSLPQILVLCAGKELVLLPQTLGPFHREFAKLVARIVLKRAKLIYSRDRESIREAGDLIGPHAAGKLRFCYDVGFVVHPISPCQLGPPVRSARGGRCLVGLNVSGLLFVSTPDGGNPFGFRDEYRQLIYNVIDLLIEGKKAKVLLIPHVFASGTESDSDACAQLYGELKSKYGTDIDCAHGPYDQNEVKYIIGQCDFFIGSRMHACIGALSQAIPAVAIAYSRKFSGVMETIGCEEIVVDPRTMSAQEMLNLIRGIYDRKEELHRCLAGKMPEVKESVLNLMPQILEPRQFGLAEGKCLCP